MKRSELFLLKGNHGTFELIALSFLQDFKALNGFDEAIIDFLEFVQGSVFNNQGLTAFQSCRHGFIRFTAVHVPVTFLATESLCGQSLWMPGHKKTALKCISRLWFHDGWMHACTVDRLDD